MLAHDVDAARGLLRASPLTVVGVGLMVAVASASLWITGQLAPLAIAVQVLRQLCVMLAPVVVANSSRALSPN